MAAWEWVPSICGLHWKPGATRIVKSGFAILGQFFCCRPNEEVADEETFAGQFIDDAEFLAAQLVGAGKAVEEVNGPVLEVGQDFALEGVNFSLEMGRLMLFQAM